MELPGRAQRVEDLVDGLVDGEQRAVLTDAEVPAGLVEAPRPPLDVGRLVGQVLSEARRLERREVKVRVGVAGRRLRRAVRSGRREEEEERAARRRRAPDEVGCEPGEHVGRVVLRRVAEVREPPVQVERVAEVPPAVGERAPLVPAGRDRRSDVAVQVLADERRAVARGVEGDCDRAALGAESREGVPAAERRPVAPHACPVRVAPGQERRSAWAAERVRHERVRERDAVGGQPLLNDAHAVGAVCALVVGEDDHDVRASGSGWVRDRCHHDRCESHDADTTRDSHGSRQ